MIAMRQSTLASGGFDAHAKTIRKAAFVARMDKLMPWPALVALIEPHYPKAGNGRPPRSMSLMLRMYCIANWFNLADEACEDALYDIEAFRDFCGVDLGREGVPDATTVRPVLPKTKTTRAIQKCTRPTKATNGTLA
jgi:transposase, IS5 family